MYKVLVGNREIKLEDAKEKLFLDGEELNFDLKLTGDRKYHLLMNDRSYEGEVLFFDPATKSLTIRVNNQKIQLQVKDKYDELLKQIGLDNLSKAGSNEVKAPMPGLVLKVLVTEGAEIKKGDNLLVLEAMKMENILKAPTDGIVKTLKVHPGDKVEKNQVLLQLK